MYNVETDVSQGILRLAFSEHVTVDEMKRCRLDVEESVGKFAVGFTVVTNLSGLDRMDFNCTPEIRGLMDFLRESGVARVIRVVPDPGKDIGFSILSYFHYGSKVKLQTFDSLIEANTQI
jgi:hypothetical protein